MKKYLLPIVLIPFLLVGCQQSNDSKENISIVPTDTYIRVDVDEIDLMEDFTYQIEVTIIKEGTLVFYSSLDNSIATVSNTGLITGVEAGKTTVTIRGGRDTYVLNVNVTQNQAQDDLQISLNKTSYTLSVDETFILPIETYLGNQKVDASINYNIVDNTIISIENNVITTLKIGNTDVIVHASYLDFEADALFKVIVY